MPTEERRTTVPSCNQTLEAARSVAIDNPRSLKLVCHVADAITTLQIAVLGRLVFMDIRMPDLR